MAFFAPAPKPKSPLGWHRVLSPNAGVKVSPLCLGAMNFGDEWKAFMGECDKDASFALMDAFYELGGNFIDTANAYQNEQSEQWIGEWMTARNVRDQMVIATKYSTYYRKAHIDTEQADSFLGNSFKTMHISIRASLRKLQTDYIDLFYVHYWDFTTGVEEIMRGLHSLVMQGKVLYLGISDSPAWVVVKANDYARQHGLTPFSVYQGRWSAADRALEREIVPMCQDQGMAIAPWGALGQGKLKTQHERDNPVTGGRNRPGPTDPNLDKVSEVLEKIATEKKTKLRSVALAYLMQKTPYVFPIVGGRKVEHLKENVDALKLELTKDDVAAINKATAFDPGFPNNFLFGGEEYDLDLGAAHVGVTKFGVHLDAPPKPLAIRPHTEL